MQTYAHRSRGASTSRASGRGAFLIGVAVVAVLLTLGVAQVPQPMRGYVVAWLLFVATVGALGLSVLRHIYAYKTKLLEKGERVKRRPGYRRERSADRARPALRVVKSGKVGGGRFVVR